MGSRLTVSGQADTLAAHRADGLGRADEELLDAGAGDGALESDAGVGDEGAVALGKVVWGVDDADGHVVVCGRS